MKFSHFVALIVEAALFYKTLAPDLLNSQPSHNFHFILCRSVASNFGTKMEEEDDQPRFVEHFIDAKLDNERRVYTWDPEFLDDSRSADSLRCSQHTLCLQEAILGMTAKEGELNLVELTTNGLDSEEIRVPLAYLQTGKMYQTSLGISLPEGMVKLSLVRGNGPVHILGKHIINSPDELDGGDIIRDGEEDSAEEEEGELREGDDDDDDDDEEEVMIGNGDSDELEEVYMDELNESD